LLLATTGDAKLVPCCCGEQLGSLHISSNPGDRPCGMGKKNRLIVSDTTNDAKFLLSFSCVLRAYLVFIFLLSVEHIFVFFSGMNLHC